MKDDVPSSPTPRVYMIGSIFVCHNKGGIHYLYYLAPCRDIQCANHTTVHRRRLVPKHFPAPAVNNVMMEKP